MDWYWVIGLIAAFIGVIALFWYMNRKGLITDDQMKSPTGVIGGLTAATTALAKTETGSEVFGIAEMVMTFVNKAVLAAENAWYNEEIERVDRYDFCIERLHEMLEAYGITLTDAQVNAVDTLISAACEEMGHAEEIVTVSEK